MTSQERQQCYEAKEAYRRKREAFREELNKYLSSYEIQRHTKKEIYTKAT